MPLLAFWESNPDEVGQTSIEQIVAMAGDGNLKDASHCSHELREYLTQADTPKLASYIQHCLSTSFPKGGLVFQDLVNELGRRLDYKVLNGRYQGTVNAIGFDGIWTSPEGQLWPRSKLPMRTAFLLIRSLPTVNAFWIAKR